MVEFINKYTGGVMWVDESRAAEYAALGHTRAGEVIAEVEMTEIVEPETIELKMPKSEPKRTARRKRDPKEW